MLHGHAPEEAAKILILPDIARCPKKTVWNRIELKIPWGYKASAGSFPTARTSNYYRAGDFVALIMLTMRVILH